MGIPAKARIAVVTTIASSRFRTGVTPVSDLRISALSADFPGLRKQRMRLTEHVSFRALDYETLAAWFHQKPDQVVGNPSASQPFSSEFNTCIQ
jgi:hypothetical protein